jgi:hypothetical protein
VLYADSHGATLPGDVFYKMTEKRMSRFTCAKQDDRSGSSNPGGRPSSSGGTTQMPDKRSVEQPIDEKSGAGQQGSKPGGGHPGSETAGTGQFGAKPGGERTGGGQSGANPGGSRPGANPGSGRPDTGARKDDEGDDDNSADPGRDVQPGSKRTDAGKTGSAH